MSLRPPHLKLILLILLALLVRLYKIQNPILDWHAWRQTDTASVTREYVKKGIDLLHPTYHDISSIPNNLDNSQHGYRMVEFPLINAATAFLLRSIPALTLAPTSRFISVLFSLGTLISLYLLVKALSSEKLAILSALTFALLPYAVYYSRVTLPEPAVLFFSTFSIYSFNLYLNKTIHSSKVSTLSIKNKFNYAKFNLNKYKYKHLFFSALALAVAFLLKPFVAFLAPVYLILLWQKYQFKFIKKYQFYLFTLIALVPFILWRKWIQQYPEGIPASTWLFNGNGIRFRPTWFRWLFYERLTKLILGYVGVIFLPLNLYSRAQISQNTIKNQKVKNHLLGYILQLLKQTDVQIYAAWWVSMIAYLSVIATGNVQHDYYQVLLIPIICISVARGALILHEIIKKKIQHCFPVWQNQPNRIKSSSCSAGNRSKDKFKNHSQKSGIKNYATQISFTITATIYFLSLNFAWQQVRGYYQINHSEYIIAGQAVDQLVDKNAKIIAPAMGDTQFLFQTNRTGWPIGFEIENKIKKGATHYVTTSMDDEAKELETKYTIVTKTQHYLILNLREIK